MMIVCCFEEGLFIALNTKADVRTDNDVSPVASANKTVPLLDDKQMEQCANNIFYKMLLSHLSMQIALIIFFLLEQSNIMYLYKLLGSSVTEYFFRYDINEVYIKLQKGKYMIENKSHDLIH